MLFYQLLLLAVLSANADFLRTSQYMPNKPNSRRTFLSSSYRPKVYYASPSKSKGRPFVLTNDAESPLDRRPTKGKKVPPAPPRTLTPEGTPNSPDPEPVTRKCLKCLCDSNTNCDLNIKCILNEFCGPYLISEKYWTEAGRPGPDYKGCAFNRTCAEETVNRYMVKNAVDCNNDGFIDCDDYVALHQLGPNCPKASSSNFYKSNYWNYYQFCYHLSTDSRREPASASGQPPPSSPGRPTDRIHGEDVGSNEASAATGGQRPDRPRPPVAHKPFNARPDRRQPSSSSVQPPSSGRPAKPVAYISTTCLDCMCQANGCNTSLPCDPNVAAYGSPPCGPYRIDFSYWSEAGRPGYRGSAGDFQRCANDLQCAQSVLRSYLTKWATDCNGDGLIDCSDYAAIQRLGPKQCHSETNLDSFYGKQFRLCNGFRN
ncbi:Lysozyme [Halotydeus destructor]|nr:Lysozyme [Halotydeus destructor]